MERTVILAAGEFPSRGSEGERLLKAACRVVACDSAAEDYHRRFRRWPDAIVGDLDSLGANVPRARCVRMAEQASNDLEKAIRYCRAEGWEDLVIVGGGGKREDHTIGNVFRALNAGVRMVTEYGEFLPVDGTLTFSSFKNAGISVFAIDPSAKMTSRGLKWKLTGVRFSNPAVATLNRASSSMVTVTSDRPASVFVERNPKAVRAAVSLGSNVGNRARYLQQALSALAKLPKTRLLDVSSVIETEPVDVPAEFADRKFLNQAALLETTLAPLAFSRAMHQIEDRLGRVRLVRNGPRTIDIDLILFGTVRMNTRELILPHPRAKARAFVRQPLKELGVTI